MKQLLTTGLVFLLLASSSKQSTMPQQESPEWLLEKLSQFDALYQNSVSVEGTVSLSPVRGSTIPIPTWKWTYTASAGDVGIVQEALSDPEIPYSIEADSVDSERNTRSRVSYDEKKNMLASIEMGRVYSFSDQKSSSRSTSILFRVAPDGTVLEKIPNNTHQHFGPDDESLILALRSMSWAIGRGFSPCIRSIDGVEQGSGELLTLTASGGAWDRLNNLGVWTLIVDPSKQYGVVDAKFVLSGLRNPYLSVEAKDFQETNGVFFPSSSSFKVSKGEPVRYTISNVKLESDKSLISKAKALTVKASRN